MCGDCTEATTRCTRLASLQCVVVRNTDDLRETSTYEPATHSSTRVRACPQTCCSSCCLHLTSTLQFTSYHRGYYPLSCSVTTKTILHFQPNFAQHHVLIVGCAAGKSAIALSFTDSKPIS